MKKFEKQIKSLPWAKPSENLRQKIFADAPSERIPMVLRFSRRAAGWAAMWILVGSIFGYCAGRFQDNSALVSFSPNEVIVVETDTDTRFFNQTYKIDEAIPGKWVLNIEPEGESQG